MTYKYLIDSQTLHRKRIKQFQHNNSFSINTPKKTQIQNVDKANITTATSFNQIKLAIKHNSKANNYKYTIK